jgi:hypothetical protein
MATMGVHHHEFSILKYSMFIVLNISVVLKGGTREFRNTVINGRISGVLHDPYSMTLFLELHTVQ